MRCGTFERSMYGTIPEISRCIAREQQLCYLARAALQILRVFRINRSVILVAKMNASSWWCWCCYHCFALMLLLLLVLLLWLLCPRSPYKQVTVVVVVVVVAMVVVVVDFMPVRLSTYLLTYHFLPTSLRTYLPTYPLASPLRFTHQEQASPHRVVLRYWRCRVGRSDPMRIPQILSPR